MFFRRCSLQSVSFGSLGTVILDLREIFALAAQDWTEEDEAWAYFGLLQSARGDGFPCPSLTRSWLVFCTSNRAEGLKALSFFLLVPEGRGRARL